MSCKDCLRIGIPARLCKEGKPELYIVKSDDLIFRRHNLIGNIDQLREMSSSEIGRDLFKFHDDSYNISALSDATDVLLNDNITENGNHYLKEGIISIKVEDVEKQSFLYNGNGILYECSFKVKHDPKECNYSHAELIYYMNSIEYKGKEPSKSAKTFFRRHLQKVMNQIKQVAN